MATIEIDGKPYTAEVGQMLIQVADANGVEIPRFCYHEKLSVAASCRMCLVEMEKAPKPVPACATPVMDGMKVWTRSPKALTAQKAVMEFLLINHPLDCPICDQGGECELQDIAVGYGNDASRYHEEKRVVLDKNIGPLIATEMTRCIHCTRCVRFGQEIAGIQELGALGRGEHTKISTYVGQTVDSELSGNVVDLCPVGALTAKPSRFNARAWELQQADSIAPHDGIGSNIHVHLRRGEIIRVVPKQNDAINEIWLSDRDRFSYQGLKAEDRLTVPMIKKDGQWQPTDWGTALQAAAEGMKRIVEKSEPDQLGALASPTATLEELYLLQRLVRGLGSDCVDHRLHQIDFSDQAHTPLFPYLGLPIADLERCNTVLIIGSHLRKEQPLLNHRLRKASMNGANILFINPIAYDFNDMRIAQQLVAAPNDLIATLAGIAKSLLTGEANVIPQQLEDLLADAKVTEEQQTLAQCLKTGEQRLILLGNLATAHPQFALVRALAVAIAKLSGAKLGYGAEAGNSAGAWLAGALPHREAAGKPISTPGLDAYAMLTQGRKGYVLLGVEPELDSYDGAKALENLQKAEFVVSLTAYITPTMQTYANVLLPISVFTETSGTYVNNAGTWQSFTAVVTPKHEVRPGWKVLRVLGNLLNISGFNYDSSEQVRNEVSEQLGQKTADNLNSWQVPADLTAHSVNGLQRITELPIYATDAIVRRASALQFTRDATTAKGVHLNSKVAAQVGTNEQATLQVRQNTAKISLPVVIDERVPDGCVLIYAGQAENVALGAWHGWVELTT
ncbi:MAG: NADH-quinone oxidoreductase subunit NuoG [Thiotrichaceae bacterium]